MTHEICSQCKKPVPINKGYTVSFYAKGEKHFKCCSVACVDNLIKKQKDTR